MSNEKDEKEGGFKVTDRRKFTVEGELREDTPPPRPVAEEKKRPDSRPPAAGQPAGRASAGVDFASFLLSLATTGMVHLGEIPDPMTGKKGNNLQAAKEMIDILTLLEEKTRGNLSADESHLLENLLYELRLKYLNKAKMIKL